MRQLSLITASTVCGRLALSYVVLTIPEPQKYVKWWPSWLMLKALGHHFAYFWGPDKALREGSSPANMTRAKLTTADSGAA